MGVTVIFPHLKLKICSRITDKYQKYKLIAFNFNKECCKNDGGEYNNFGNIQHVDH